MRNLILTLAMGLTASQSALAATEIYKMYKESNAVINETCDIYTQLELNVEGDFGTATLTDHLKGDCKIRVPENKRSYPIALVDLECRSKIYQNVENSKLVVEVMDNRGRTCRDRIGAKIIVKEYRSGTEKVLYSKDN